MERVFSFRRFWLLVVRHGSENLKTYALAWGIISLVILFITVVAGSDNMALLGMFPLMLCMVGAVFCSTVFSPWSNFGKSSFYLLLPATATEKFVTGIFYCLILFIPLFTILYFATGILFIFFMHPVSVMKFFHIQFVQVYNSRVFIDIFMAFLLIQSITIIGTIVFKRRQLMISLLLVVVIFLFFTVLTYFQMKGLTGTEVTTRLLPFYNYGFGIETGAGSMRSAKIFHFTHVINNLNYLVWTIVILLVYLSAWFKLREREL
ncbi:MAG: hypothetical protein WCL00_00410 [Bacteroidota bacterium]